MFLVNETATSGQRPISSAGVPRRAPARAVNPERGSLGHLRGTTFLRL
jgi:hypothetical protein